MPFASYADGVVSMALLVITARSKVTLLELLASCPMPRLLPLHLPVFRYTIMYLSPLLYFLHHSPIFAPHVT